MFILSKKGTALLITNLPAYRIHLENGWNCFTSMSFGTSREDAQRCFRGERLAQDDGVIRLHVTAC